MRRITYFHGLVRIASAYAGLLAEEARYLSYIRMRRISFLRGRVRTLLYTCYMTCHVIPFLVSGFGASFINLVQGITQTDVIKGVLF